MMTRVPISSHVLTTYGTKVQFAECDSLLPVGNKQKHVQMVNGEFLGYGHAVDNTLLTSLSKLAAQQAKLMK